MTWSSVAFPQALQNLRVGRQNQIPASEIKPVGKYPVIDQGQTFVSGPLCKICSARFCTNS